MRFSGEVKTGAYECVIWRIEDGSGDFYLKVPNRPECKPVRDYFWKLMPVQAQYFAKGGSLEAWQWRLPNEYRGLLKLAKVPRG